MSTLLLRNGPGYAVEVSVLNLFYGEKPKDVLEPRKKCTLYRIPSTTSQCAGGRSFGQVRQRQGGRSLPWLEKTLDSVS